MFPQEEDRPDLRPTGEKEEKREIMNIINLPNVLDDNGAISFINDLNNSLEYPNVQMCFRNLSFVRPFGVLVSAEAFKDFVTKRKKKGFETYYMDSDWLKKKNSGAISYLKYFGFFKYCGIPIGEEPNKVFHTSTYFPIQTIEKSELEKESFFGNWRNIIEKKCAELSKLITNDEIAYTYLDYALREIIRNVFEHSNVTQCSLMAQCYANDEIEIAVADRGVGIHNTLKDKYRVDNPIDSLLLSMEPGVSRVNIEKSKGEWGNSGFGLYILSGVGKEYGTFSLLSSCAYLSLFKEDKKILVDNNYFNGTAIKLNVKKSYLEYFPNLRKKLIDEGENKYLERYGKKIRASGKSKKS